DAEQVDLGDVLVLLDGGLLRRVLGEAAEVQVGAAVGPRLPAQLVGVGDVVVVAVEVGVHVVAACVSELGAGDAVGVVPAERRGGRVRRGRLEGEAAVLRALVGPGGDVVGGLRGPVGLGHPRAGRAVHAQVL